MKTSTKPTPSRKAAKKAPIGFSQSTPIHMSGDDKPIVEREFANFRGFAGFNAAGPLANTLPVISTKGHEGIDKMMQDDTLGTCIALKKAAALSTPWSWEAASGEDETHKTHQAYLTEVFERLDAGEQDPNGINVGVVEKMRDILSAVEHGFSITNAVYCILEGGEFNGKYGVSDMKTKPPHGFQFETDEFGNILPDGLVQNYTDRLPVDQFLIASYNPPYGNPYGYSDCIRAYDRWNAKVLFQKFEAIHGERHGCGTWVVTESTDNPGTSAERAVVDSFLRGASAKSSARIPDKFTVNQFEPGAGSGDYWDTKINRLNMQIARAVFNPDKTGFSANDSGGAYAIGKVHMDMYLLIVTSLQRFVAGVMKRLGRRLIDYSFGPQDKYPNFVFAPMTSDQKHAWLTAVGQLTKDGYLNPADETVSKKVRELMELPEDPKLDPEMVKEQEANKAMQEADEDVDTEEADEENLAAPDPEAVIAAALAVVKENERTVIVAGPKAGKTTVATIAAERFKIKARYGDSLIGTADWPAMSERVAEWFETPGKWVIEGVVTVRAIRKWLAANPDTKPPFAVLVLQNAIQQRGKAHASMAASVTTIWNEIQPELEARGAKVVIV